VPLVKFIFAESGTILTLILNTNIPKDESAEGYKDSSAVSLQTAELYLHTAEQCMETAEVSLHSSAVSLQTAEQCMETAELSLYPSALSSYTSAVCKQTAEEWLYPSALSSFPIYLKEGTLLKFLNFSKVNIHRILNYLPSTSVSGSILTLIFNTNSQK
jgi:hypothetical protein